MKKYFIKVKGFFNEDSEGYPVTFRTVDESEFDNEIKVLNKMLGSGEINSYEVHLDSEPELECTCFTCDPVCDIIKPKNSHRSAVLKFYDGYFNGRYKIPKEEPNVLSTN